MSNYNADLRVLGSKAESTPGTPIGVGLVDYDVRVRDVQMSPEIEEYARKYARGEHSNDASIMGKRSGTITFSVDVAGSGAAGTAPKLAKFLKACGYKETVSAGVSVAYAPNISQDVYPITIEVREYYNSGTAQQLTFRFGSCMGKVALVCDTVGAPMRLDFEFKGKYLGETDETTIKTITGEDTTVPPAVLNATVNRGAVDQRIDKFTLDGGEVIELLDDPGEATGLLYGYVASRKSTLSWDPELQRVSDDTVYADWIAGTEAAINIDAGATAGNIIAIDIPKSQYVTRSIGVRKGATINEIQMNLNRSSGNDEWTLTFT